MNKILYSHAMVDVHMRNSSRKNKNKREEERERLNLEHVPQGKATFQLNSFVPDSKKKAENTKRQKTRVLYAYLDRTVYVHAYAYRLKAVYIR